LKTDILARTRAFAPPLTLAGGQVNQIDDPADGEKQFLSNTCGLTAAVRKCIGTTAWDQLKAMPKKFGESHRLMATVVRATAPFGNLTASKSTLCA
jgi:hypothetical protein